MFAPGVPCYTHQPVPKSSCPLNPVLRRLQWRLPCHAWLQRLVDFSLDLILIACPTERAIVHSAGSYWHCCVKSVQVSPVRRLLLLFYPHLTAGQTECQRVNWPDTHSQEVEEQNLNPNLLNSSLVSLRSTCQGLSSLGAGAVPGSAQASSRDQCKALNLVNI